MHYILIFVFGFGGNITVIGEYPSVAACSKAGKELQALEGYNHRLMDKRSNDRDLTIVCLAKPLTDGATGEPSALVR